MYNYIHAQTGISHTQRSTRTQTELDLIVDKHQSGKPGGLRGKWSDGAEENDRKPSEG